MNDQKDEKKRFQCCPSYPQFHLTECILTASNKLKIAAEKKLLTCKLLVQCATLQQLTIRNTGHFPLLIYKKRGNLEILLFKANISTGPMPWGSSNPPLPNWQPPPPGRTPHLLLPQTPFCNKGITTVQEKPVFSVTNVSIDNSSGKTVFIPN